MMTPKTIDDLIECRKHIDRQSESLIISELFTVIDKMHLLSIYKMQDNLFAKKIEFLKYPKS